MPRLVRPPLDQGLFPTSVKIPSPVMTPSSRSRQHARCMLILGQLREPFHIAAQEGISSMNLKTFIKDHPVASYCLPVVLWSFVWWTLILTEAPIGGFFDPPLKPSVIGLLLAGLVAPSVFGLVLTRIIDGKGSLVALLARLGRWRVGWWWLTPLIPFALNIAVYYAYALSTGDGATPEIATKIGPAIGMGLLAGLFEEFGWRGFLLPRLQQRYSSLVSALLVGLIWGGIWHLYGDYIGAFGNRGWWGVTLVVLQAPVLLTAFSILLTWVYNGTRGSMLLCVVFHFAISSSAVLFMPTYPSSPVYLAWAAIFALLAWSVAGAVVVLGKRQMSRQRLQLRSA